jgi:predicted permease
LTLALGTGANTAIFSLIDSLMLKSLPVSHPEELVQVNMAGRGIWGVEQPMVSNPVWEQLRDRQDFFSGLFGYAIARFDLAARGEARYVQGNYVSGQFFETLGLRPIAGRIITTDDDRRGCPGTAVLSYSFWHREYGGRTEIVGTRISLDNHPFEILGVIGAAFTGVDVGRKSDIYVPICAERFIGWNNGLLDGRRGGWLRVIGRAAPRFSINQVQARLKTLAGPIMHATTPLNIKPSQREMYLKHTFHVQMAGNGLSSIRSKYRQALIVLMVIVGAVLFIACSNLANLLARGAARQREIAIRMALGSGRGRLIRQLLVESLLLSVTGAALGMVFARWVGLPPSSPHSVVGRGTSCAHLCIGCLSFGRVSHPNLFLVGRQSVNYVFESRVIQGTWPQINNVVAETCMYSAVDELHHSGLISVPDYRALRRCPLEPVKLIRRQDYVK